MDSPVSYQPYLDELIAFGSSADRTPALIAAKAEYFDHTGEVFEDDKAFEMRMASFLDYYLFDRAGADGKTPAQELYDQKLQTLGADGAHVYRGFTETQHGLFEVKKMGTEQLRLRELFSGKDLEVTERRKMAGLEKGDLIEARLVPFGGMLLFSNAFCYHPKAATKAILKEIKRRKKKEPHRTPREMTWDCSKRALKVDRYRQIAVEKLYDFENKTI
ncbi:MAG: hypothetical protein M3Y59_19075 [Myxococcota bacterium]|nr:hypothetical protein [Myxococcota bacterium]